MICQVIVRKNTYYDSVFLMRMSSKLEGIAGTEVVMVGMGTDLNKESFQRLDLLDAKVEKATPNDLVIGIKAKNPSVIDAALALVETMLSGRREEMQAGISESYSSLEQAKAEVDSNLAVISTPGAFAVREASKALALGMHVFLFSDNVSLEDEIALKTSALDKGLLLMGPDCGTAIINGVPLGFANKVRSGDIGVVAASGTGLQHFTTLVDFFGAGISQAIGVGGRDLSDTVGGLMTLQALDALKYDDSTKVIAVISKPPGKKVEKQILAATASLGKPVVLCLLGVGAGPAVSSIVVCRNIEQAAKAAVALSTGRETGAVGAPPHKYELSWTEKQRFMRGLFCGGTLADEAALILTDAGVPFHSNTGLGCQLADPEISQGNTILDLGEDYFTRGKPHPLIEPDLRNPRLIAEATDSRTRVVLFDVVLGYGAHKDPAGVVAAAIEQAQIFLAAEQRRVMFVASFVGAVNDPQGYKAQKEALEKRGVVVFESNVQAARYAASLLK